MYVWLYGVSDGLGFWEGFKGLGGSRLSRACGASGLYMGVSGLL